jgi:hypothetical protein
MGLFARLFRAPCAHCGRSARLVSTTFPDRPIRSDPLNLFVGPLVYGGDAEGIAAGLELRVEWVQGGALLLLLTGRELAARALFPFYETGRPPWLFRPLPVFHRRS